MPDELNPQCGPAPMPLDDAIRAWRRRLEADGMFGPAALDELEDHLRTEIGRLETTGLSPVERVQVAAFRVGAPDALAEQFAAVHRGAVWASRLRWMVAGFLAVTVLDGLVFTPIQKFQVVGYNLLGWDPSSTIALTCLGMSAALALLLSVVLPWALRRANSRAGVPGAGLLKRPVALVAGVVLLPWLVAFLGSMPFYFPVISSLDDPAAARFLFADQVTQLFPATLAALLMLIVASVLRRKAA